MQVNDAYSMTVLVMGLMAALSFAQLLILDVAGLKGRHKPGHPIEVDQSSFLFRAFRSHANTNESVAIFILLAMFGIFSAASPNWLNNSAALYLLGRLLHMLFYYSNYSLARSVAFGLSLFGLAGMLIAGFLPWL
ncbi:MAPEG family protein [uncultured Pseudoteredinibacter sp.]|uniref:MAPEG family protein n=1 Tax=uncultured Pseudoteredinibacter sp. TaxID=1641701 RepID=UPI00261FA6E7|nr:MAPEG family protein [uncultured Pseudoteredinibacter sp.]